MSDSKITFDVSTANPFESRVGGSPHHTYRDANGNMCLVCVGKSPNGGVAVNQGALDRLVEWKEGARFVRLINEGSRFDVTVELEALPKKPTLDGRYGAYTFFDPADCGTPPPFPPPADDRPF
jgi:hypothetical protein